MALTDTAIKNLKATGKKYKSYDSGGLYLEVSPAGGKRWRFKYRYLGKEKLLSLGIYPDVKLKKAREKRDEHRTLLSDGIDPSAHRKAVKAAGIEKFENNFEVIAREWHKKFSQQWSPSHSKRLQSRLERDILPWLGKMPVTDLKPQNILKCVRRIEDRGALESAHRALQNCSQVFVMQLQREE